MSLKISIVGTVGVPACYGGFETLADNLLTYSSPDVQYTVFCSSKVYAHKRYHYKGALLKYVGLKPNGIFSILYDGLSIGRSLHADVILLLGVSGAIFLPFARLLFRGRIITNVDGIEWKRPKWARLARMVLHFSEWLAVLFSDVIVGDNKAIVRYIKESYNVRASLIEYGGDHVEKMVPRFNSSYPFLAGPYAISVCRIVPENNIATILSAFALLGSMPCVVVGNWYASAYGRILRSRFSSSSNLYLLDPIYDATILNGLRGSATLYVHGHSAGGTNPSLVEAMSLGLPIAAFDCEYNRETTEGKCLYFKDADALINILQNSTPREFRQMGLAMSNIARRRYTWGTIAEKYETLFQGYRAWVEKSDARAVNTNVIEKQPELALTK